MRWPSLSKLLWIRKKKGMNWPQIIALLLTAADSGKSGIVKPPVADSVILTIELEHKCIATHLHKGGRNGANGHSEWLLFSTVATNGKAHISPCTYCELRFPARRAAGPVARLHRGAVLLQTAAQKQVLNHCLGQITFTAYISLDLFGNISAVLPVLHATKTERS